MTIVDIAQIDKAAEEFFCTGRQELITVDMADYRHLKDSSSFLRAVRADFNDIASLSGLSSDLVPLAGAKTTGLIMYLRFAADVKLTMDVISNVKGSLPSELRSGNLMFGMRPDPDMPSGHVSVLVVIGVSK